MKDSLFIISNARNQRAKNCDVIKVRLILALNNTIDLLDKASGQIGYFENIIKIRVKH